MHNERLQILLSTELRARLDREARARNTSVAALVRHAIEATYGSNDKDDRAAAVDAIRRLAGRFLPPDELDEVAEDRFG